MIKKSHSYLYIILTHIVGNTNTLGLGWIHFFTVWVDRVVGQRFWPGLNLAINLDQIQLLFDQFFEPNLQIFEVWATQNLSQVTQKL